ncbi:DNase1 protein [Colletotrichum karsti]|uniref:DNase1 protein n=1 Tax=Colletotrichum karsti TaxID=1095194 RepID=A0A9P6LQU9_9PEZI|nr:DNase1 protein [Colletotrichum karsti]KAF9881237.1 DNase1 protein [Colletotrichum karsti]
MQFSTLALLGSAALAAAGNTITFNSLDEVDRTVYFIANAGLASVESVKVPGKGTTKVDIPDSWIGNWYSVSDGEENVTGMLGEVAFNGWNGLTYFDVSAIVNPNDHNGVKKMYPASGATPTSGCDCYPCNEAYYLPDDVQTKVTSETDLVTTLGNNNCTAAKRSVFEETESVKRDFVLGKH